MITDIAITLEYNITKKKIELCLYFKKAKFNFESNFVISKYYFLRTKSVNTTVIITLLREQKSKANILLYCGRKRNFYKCT